VRGVTANLADMDVEEVAAGRYISNGDNDHRTTVAFIGTDIVKHLFPKEDPINKNNFGISSAEEIANQRSAPAKSACARRLAPGAATLCGSS
jgi:hypothetical protein